MKFLLTIALFLILVAPASADPVGQRIADEINRTNFFMNTTEFTPTFFEEWSTACGNDQKIYLQAGEDANGNPFYEWSWPPAHLINRMQVDGVPLPCFFEPSAGTDQESVLIWNGDKSGGQRDYYEFWGAHWKRRYDGTYGWSTRWGAAVNWNELGYDPVSKAHYFQNGDGTQASGITFIDTVIRLNEVDDSRLGHPIGLIVPEACGWEDVRFPAQRTDGWGSMQTNGWCVPYGAFLKFPPDAQAAWWASDFAKKLVEWGKTDGFLVTDQTHNNVGIRGENPSRLYGGWEGNPWPKILGGQNCVDHPEWWSCYPDKNNIFNGIPWDQLRLVN
jgi:hypothetical protein